MESDIINRALQSTRGISESMRALDSALMEEGIHKRKATDAQIVLPHLLSGDATFQAIEHAVADLVKRVPQDHDVLILVDDLTVHDARFIGPHTFLFEGVNPEGHRAAVVCHFSQVKVFIVYLPKRSNERFVSKVIRGFASDAPSEKQNEAMQ